MSAPSRSIVRRVSARFAAPAVQGVLVSIIVLTALWTTAADYGLTVDEPRYIVNNEKLHAWFADFSNVGPADNLRRDRLSAGWYFARADSKNLPLVSLLSTVVHAVATRWMSPLTAYRLGNLLVFAATCGAVYFWMAREYSPTVGLVSVAAVVGTPRLFGHAHFASIDPLVACCWVTASLAMLSGRRGWRGAILFGVLCGLGLTTKPTFWFAVPVWVVWGTLYVLLPFRTTPASINHRDPVKRVPNPGDESLTTAMATGRTTRLRELVRPAVCLLTVAPLTAYLFLPMWWTDPVGGFFSYLTMLRTDPQGWQIATYYLGEIYQTAGRAPVPWHAAVVLPLVTTPLWVMLLCAVGLWSALRRWRSNAAMVLWLLSGLVLPLVCALPNTPAHDGIRLYQTAFYFAALMAGSGFDAVRRRWLSRPLRLRNADATSGGKAARRWWARRQWHPAIAALMVCAAGLWSVSRIHPAELSYYNMLIGGFPGAARPRAEPPTLPVIRRPLFEISYWWELMPADQWRAMQSRLPAGAKLWVFPEHFGLAFLRRWGELRDDIEIVGPERADYVLLYGRLGRLLEPQARPLGRMFLEDRPVWELRREGVRVAGLYRWHR